MTCLEWSRQIEALRTGELRLLAPEEGELSQFARGHFDDLKEYTKALEHGYRAVCEKLDGYRKHERTSSVKCGNKTIAELLANQWSDEAALGYAYLAACMIGLSPDRAVQLLETLGDVMEHYDLDYVKALHRGLVEGGGTEGRQIAGATDGGETPHSTALRRSPGEAQA